MSVGGSKAQLELQQRSAREEVSRSISLVDLVHSLIQQLA
jgi:hypothetical protein